MSDHDAGRDILTEDSRPHARRPAPADQDLDQDRDLRGLGGAGQPPSALHDRRLPTSTNIEQAGPSVDSLQQVIRDLHESEAGALEDRDLADREIRRLRREADVLRRELQQVREEDPKSQMIRDVCDYWMQALGKTKRTKCPTNGARWNKVRSRMNDGYTAAQLKRAIDGCARFPFVGPRGRQPDEQSGAKRHDDLELICRDETTVERFIGYADQADKLKACTCSPTTGDVECQVHTTPVERATRFKDESDTRQFVRFAYDGKDQLPHLPAGKEPRPRAVSSVPPIDRVLGALHGLGCNVVAYQAHADQWSAQCPAHEDRDPSLSIHRNPDGKILLRCWAGCLTEDVIAALHLEWRDLWEDSDRDVNRANKTERTIPAHLRTAMQQLLARDERAA